MIFALLVYTLKKKIVMPKDSDVDGMLKTKNVDQDVIAVERVSVTKKIGIQIKKNTVDQKLFLMPMNSLHISVKETVSMKIHSDKNVKKKLMIQSDLKENAHQAKMSKVVTLNTQDADGMKQAKCAYLDVTAVDNGANKTLGILKNHTAKTKNLNKWKTKLKKTQKPILLMSKIKLILSLLLMEKLMLKNKKKKKSRLK